MDKSYVKSLLTGAGAVQNDASTLSLELPRDEGLPAKGQQVLARSLVRGSRSYIERVAEQINGAYENGLYDACAVMIRRLVETLIIELFEHHSILPKIQDMNGDILHLSRLVPLVTSETTWHLGRNAKKSLPKLKDIGDLSAHSRRYNAHRSDIDDIKSDLRLIVQELLALAGLK
jgi:hypothetical protein